MPWLEDLKFPRGYQMGTHILKYINEDMYNYGDEFLALFVVSCFNLYA